MSKTAQTQETYPDEYPLSTNAGGQFKNYRNIAFEESNPNYKSQAERDNPIAFIFFFYVIRLMKTCIYFLRSKKQLEAKNIPGMPWKYRPEVLGQRMANIIADQKKKNPNQPPNMFATIWKTTWFGIVGGHVLEVIMVFSRIIQCYFIYKTIKTLMNPDAPHYMVYVWGAILSATMLIAFVIEHHAFLQKYMTPMYVKGALVHLMYAKINKLSVYSINRISIGKLINIVTNDMNVFDRGGEFFTDLVVGVISLIAATALLWHFFNVTVLVGIGYMLAGFPMQIMIAKFSVNSRVNLNKATDERVKVTSELIEGIRLLKMYTWELVFRDKIKKLRETEVKYLKQVRMYDSLSRTVALSAQVVSPFLIFLTYNLTGGTLNIATVFPAYFLLSYIRFTGILLVSFALTFITEVQLLCARISEVLDYPEIEAINFPQTKDSTNEIEYEDFSAFWTKEEPQDPSQAVDQEKSAGSPVRPTIFDINMNIKKGSLNAIVGKVGSGKSSFLLSLTGEMPKTLGSLRYNGTIAYVEQEPTIFAGTIRESILFGKPYRPDFYQRVITDCNLESDLKLFSNGDLSEVGEKGTNLSGGQRARLALARAVYADADIYLLDDPLSAVDAKVAKSLFNNAISTLLKDKTVILATHQVHFVKELKNIMVIEDGTVVAHGSYEDIKKTYKNVDKIFTPEQAEDEKNNEKAPKDARLTETTNPDVNVETQTKKVEVVDSDEGAPVGTADDTGSGDIGFKTYMSYFTAMGSVCMWLFLFTAVISNLLANIAFGRMLAAWAGGELSRKVCLAVLGSLSGYIIIAYYVQYQIIYAMCIRASNIYHDRMLDTIVRSPVLFFDKNPVGRILSRFANDLGVMDMFLSMTLLDVIDVLSMNISLLITLAVLFPWTLLPSFGLVGAIMLFVFLTLPAIKLTKTFELMSRSPFSSQFSSTLAGIIIIRSYRQVALINKKFVDYLNTNLKATIAVTVVTRCFGFYVDMIYNFCSIGSVYIVISLGQNEPGLAAFGLILILNILGTLQYGLKQTMQTHLLMASPARIQSYYQTKTEAELVQAQDAQLKKNGWPKQANIDFNHVYMKYRPENDFVLRDLTLNVKPGQKIGCVGRTGAGKSTIIQVLFRMVEIDRSGDNATHSSLIIDGMDTQKVGLHLVRDSISIIPQTPFIFADTIRKNLDPLGYYNDETLWSALMDVNLKEHVERLPNKLDTDMTNVASTFSVGQKQLICLARAILKRSKILVLDEATANVDKQTDDFIQKKIMERFGDCTIFTIAHRLSTIANYDRVLVLDKGSKKEFDEPYKLLVKAIGDKTITNENGHFASMVMNTGPIASQDILNIAKVKYDQDHPEEK